MYLVYNLDKIYKLLNVSKNSIVSGKKSMDEFFFILIQFIFPILYIFLGNVQGNVRCTTNIHTRCSSEINDNMMKIIG